ncbi:YggS family pyridoxal phosphate enzyme [Bhargavaea cecembensis]|uniref:Pyridoxal phosphate homeostasis protein n=1 Tax=Bhargavaea cecembensis TaxID=394098 RepID=A0A163FAH8_9BACL|nr:YggS family pyridoxal phosphate enzyme [Bhargavaea cecembensis]
MNKATYRKVGIELSTVAERLNNIQQQIRDACRRSARNPEEVTIVAVTKSVGPDRAREVIDSGIRHLGENRNEGLDLKQSAIGDDANWHFIGSLQSRKVRDVIGRIDFLHSLDRKSLAKEIQKRAERPVDCFVQVNVSGEVSKSGISPGEVEEFIRMLGAYDKIRVVGLMTMAPNTEDDEIIRSTFRGLRKVRDEISSLGLPHAPCTELSMGMSNDFGIAVEEGATFVRIGTAIVGYESGERS